MDLTVARAALDALQRHAKATLPEECCGLLLGTNDGVAQALPAPNIAADKLRQFEIDPQALIDAHRASRAGGPQVLGYYHSHPAGPAAPSTTDQARASGDRRVWAIVGQDGVTFWRDVEGGFVPLSYIVQGG